MNSISLDVSSASTGDPYNTNYSWESGAKKSGGSIRVVKQRVDWNPGLKRSLVNILHEFKDSGYRNDNGWNSEGWNRMVKEFHVRNKTLG
uniref:Myb/SANT-like domain-containing protein n=1 Tax=Zea mays TaxID=4577 RepID=A0A804QAE1_MAIZE